MPGGQTTKTGVEGRDGIDLSSAKPFSEDILRLNSVSRKLRGGADYSDMVEEVHSIMQAQLDSVKSMQTMHEEGNYKGIAHKVKAAFGDVTALAKNVKDSTEYSNSNFPSQALADLAFIGNSSLDEIPDSHIAKLFEPKLLNDITIQMQDVVAILQDVKSMLHPSAASPRRLKFNLFSEGSKKSNEPYMFEKDNVGFEPNSKTGHSQSSRDKSTSWNFSGSQNIQNRLYNSHIHLPDISKFLHTGDDADSVNRRLKVDERHKRRLQATDVCARQQCIDNDMACHCNRLKSCIDDMSDYDMALLFIGNMIETDPDADDFAKLEEGLNLFDADFNIVQKISRIRDLALKNDCTNLLPELHSACDPLQQSCSGKNSHSFQLSIDDVCNAVNTPTKLLFSSISDEMDGYWGDDGN